MKEQVMETYERAMIRLTDGRTYMLKGWPAEPQKLINKMNTLDEHWEKDRPGFIEAYDNKGHVHLVNAMYVAEVYLEEGYRLKEE